MINIKKFVLIYLLLIICTFSFGQRRGHKKISYTSAGISLNAMNYVGDLDPAQNPFSPSLLYTRWNFGAEVNHRYTAHWTARGSFAYGRIQGDDAKVSTTEGDDKFRHNRNLSFRNDIYELKADLVYDFFPSSRGFRRRAHYTPYLFAGVAGFYHNPKAKYDGEWVNLRPLNLEGQDKADIGNSKKYYPIAISIPMGLGVRFKLNDILDLSFEIGWRKTFTDHIDDVGGDYIDKANFEYGSTAYWLSDRSITEDMIKSGAVTGPEFYSVQDGDVTHYYRHGYGAGAKDEWRGDKKGRDDWYIVTGFHLNYIFHNKVSCPKFRG